MATALLRLPEVMARTGLSKSQIYLREAQGTFPKRVAIGIRASAWVSEEVEKWIHDRIRQARNPNPPEAA